jgi:hypothetical protein
MGNQKCFTPGITNTLAYFVTNVSDDVKKFYNIESRRSSCLRRRRQRRQRRRRQPRRRLRHRRHIGTNLIKLLVVIEPE